MKKQGKWTPRKPSKATPPLSDKQLAISAVAGLVVALATVWRIVARATHTLRNEIGTLRDEIKKDTKREIDMLRENDLRHLAEGIKGLDTRIDRVEGRVTQSISRLERRLTDSMLQLEARMTDGQAARGSLSA